MPALLQIAKSEASINLCSLREARIYRPLQNASMDDTKNGGPNFLQAWREFRGMTQEELAEKVGTTGAVISLLEAGERGLSAKWLRRLAPALDTQPGHLLEHDPRELDTDIVDIWMIADARERRQLIQIAKTIVHKTGTNG